jgi:hypothetical protein
MKKLGNSFLGARSSIAGGNFVETRYFNDHEKSAIQSQKKQHQV